MYRRQVLRAVCLYNRSLQNSQACGHLQLSPFWTAGHFHTAALQAATGVLQDHPQLAQLRTLTTGSLAACLHPQTNTWPMHQSRGAAAFSSSPQSRSEEDLRVVQAEITENEYHKLADEALDLLQEKLEVFVEDLDIDGGDVEHAQGVLTVRLGSHGTYVINKQTPNRQIWMSSPLTGPFRYDYHHGSWVYHRDGRELLSQLQQELKELLGSAPHLKD